MMPNSFAVLLLSATLCLTAGCAYFPKFQNLSFEDQKTIKTAEQWNVLANSVANRINDELIRQNYLSASVYVRHDCGHSAACRPGESSPFDEAFNDLLVTQLASFGVHTLKSQEGATLIIDYKVQLVYHGHYEMIITTSIIDKTRYVLRSSDIYAIKDEDYWKYKKALPAAEIELTSRGSFSNSSKTK